MALNHQLNSWLSNEQSTYVVSKLVKSVVNQTEVGVGRGITSLLHPMLISKEDYTSILSASRRLLQVMHRALVNLLYDIGVEGVLALFQQPCYIKGYIDWEKLRYTPPAIARVDIIPGMDATFKVCEINVDSSVGGAEAYPIAMRQKEIIAELNPFFKTCATPQPYDLLGSYFRQLSSQYLIDQIVVLDWRG